VALKIEKRDKSQNILNFEFSVLQVLQTNRNHIAKVYEYVNNSAGDQNFIVMELLGSNLAKVKRNQPLQKLSRVYATHLLMQMLDAIEEVHKAGFIHRDIKAVRLSLIFLVQLRS